MASNNFIALKQWKSLTFFFLNLLNQLTQISWTCFSWCQFLIELLQLWSPSPPSNPTQNWPGRADPGSWPCATNCFSLANEAQVGAIGCVGKSCNFALTLKPSSSPTIINMIIIIIITIINMIIIITSWSIHHHFIITALSLSVSSSTSSSSSSPTISLLHLANINLR